MSDKATLGWIQTAGPDIKHFAQMDSCILSARY